MRIILTALLLTLSYLPLVHAGEVTLDNNEKQLILHNKLELLEDRQGILDLSDIVNGEATNNFRDGGKDYFSLGFTNSVYWYRVSIDNPYDSLQERLLVLRTAWIDNIELYIPRLDGTHQRKVMGDQLPFAQREFDHHQFISSLSIPPGKSVFLLRVNTPKPFMTPLFLWEPEAFSQYEWSYAIYYGVIFGALFIMFLYNGIIYASIRDKRYLYYCLYLAAFFIMNFSYSGFSYQYLWPESPRWAGWAPSLFVYLFQVTGLLFAMSFLSSRRRMPRLHLLLTGSIIFLLAAPLITFIAGNELLFNKLAIYSVFFYSPLIAYAGLLALYTGFRAARFFVIASLASLLGAFFTALTVAGFLTYSFISFHAVEFGLMVDMVLLSLAMADRINLANKENMQAQQQLILQEKEAQKKLLAAKESLEKMVSDRTQELEMAKELAELQARTDYLTGLNNRHAFEEYATTEIARSRRYQQPLSLIMFDLDRFKEINDRYGHAGGDAVLFTAGQTSRLELRDTDILGRLGGEEFAVLLPGIGLGAALITAERLREAFVDDDIEHGELIMSYTASFGVTELTADDDDLDDLITRADKALYQAKQDGRNRVVTR